ISTEWESPEAITAKLAGIIAIVLLSGFFVATEFALVKVRGSQLDPLVDEGDARATRAKYVLGHLDAYLSATQFGVTLASLALGWLGEPYFSHLIQPLGVLVGVHSTRVISGVSITLGFIAITFLHIIIGELAPKYLSIRDP